MKGSILAVTGLLNIWYGVCANIQHYTSILSDTNHISISDSMSLSNQNSFITKSNILSKIILSDSYENLKSENFISCSKPDSDYIFSYFNSNSEISSSHYHDSNSLEFFSSTSFPLSFSFSSFTSSEFLQVDDDNIHDDFENKDDDYKSDDHENNDDDLVSIDNYNKFVKIDLDIVGETTITFDEIKQDIFINGVSVVVSINRKLIWFESIADVFYQRRVLKIVSRNLGQQGVNAILGIAVDENNGNNTITLFENSITDGTFVSMLSANGMSVSLNINEISLVSSPNLITDDDDINNNPLLPDDSNESSDSINLNIEIIIGLSSGAGFIIMIFVVSYINKLRNKVKPSKNELPFTNIVSTSLNRYMPYYKKHKPNSIDVVNNETKN